MNPKLARSFRDLTRFDLDARSIRLLPMAYCRRNLVVILGKVDLGDDLPVIVGMLQADNEALLSDMRNRLAKEIEPVRLNRYEIERALSLQTGKVGDETIVFFADEEPDPNATPSEIIDYILQLAVGSGASDIHIESYHHDVDLRLRIDGILHQQFTHVSPSNVSELISRLKIMSGLDITERRKPQDGRFRITFMDGEKARTIIDFRVSIVPSPGGEDAVLRVLDSSQGLLPLSALGMLPDIQDTFTRLLENPEGMVLVVGPTGSGKTTTLYAALAHIRTDSRKIVTAEDPIEYYLDKVNQKEATPVMTIAELTRSLMRQDPDVMLYGEIRDADMGEIAITAAATGHVVLSTLHTADAIGAVVRLRTLGLEDDEIASALLGVLGQRLVRRICAGCRHPTLPSERVTGIFGGLLDGVLFFKGSGCEVCRGTGYKGRVGLFELMMVDENLQDMIAHGENRIALRRYVRDHGFSTMLEDGLKKVDRGETTLEELVRVLPYRQILIERADKKAAAERVTGETG